MAVFKATENKKQTGNGKFKATQYKSFDSTLVYEWESKNKDSLNSLNNYFTKINNGEYLTVDDLEVYKKSLNSYIDTTSRLRGLNKTFGDGYNEEDEKKWTDAITSLQTDYDNASKFYSSFKTENDFARYQNGIKLRDDALNAEDFKEYSKLGIEKGVDTDFKWATTKHGQLELFSNVHNDMIITYRENPDLVADLADVSGGRTYAADALNYARLMTDEEYGIYTYYYGKDKGLAKDYLKSIEATLNSRQADKIVDSIGDNGFLKMAFGLYAGLDQYISGVENLFSDEDYYVPSASQIASGDIRESLADDGFKILGNSIGQIGYDLLNTTANMLPSILVGTVTGSIGGLATMGVSVYGNSYAEMINLGYNKGQAAAYATLTTAAELGLQSVLGGISSLGGSKSLSKMALNALDSVDNAIGRVALKMGTSMFSEGIEEAAQSVLEPVFKAIVTRGEEWDGIDWGEVAYSGLLGALSAGVLESVPTIVKDRQTVKAGQQVLKVEGVETLKDIGNKFAANTVAYQLAGKVDENTGAYKIGRLLHEVNATLTEQNKTDIVEALKSNNIKPEDAKVIAEALGAVVDGVELTKKQQAVLDGNEIASKVFADVIVNQNSTYNQRMAGYIELQKAMESGTKLTPKEKGVNNATETFESTDSSSEVKTAQESQFSHHDDGKTIYKGEEVSVKEISSIKDGAVTVRLEDGREVDAKEIDFGSEDEALMYEMVASMGVTPETAKYMMDTYNTGKGTVSISDYRADAPLAYQSGKIGYVRGTANLRLTDMQKLDLFARGRKDATAEAEAKQSHMDKNRVDASKSENTTKKSGRVTYLDGAKPSGSRQKSTVKLIEILSESIGNNWYVFSSYVENGRRVYKDKDGRIKAAPNGMYDTTTGDIYIDLHAGQNGEGLMIFTMAHELTHFIRQWSPEKFKVFADFLVEQYGEKGVSVDQLIQRKIDNAKAKGRELSYDNAYEEVIADSCETMLRDSNAIDAIAKLKAKDQTVWEKIKDFISRLVEKIRAAYAKLDPDSVEGRMVLEMKEAAEQLQALWTEALVDAGETYRETLSNNGIMVDSNTESASLYSVRDLLDSKQQQQVAKALAERFDVTVEEAKNWISAETSLASIILNPKYSQYLDYTADPNEVAIKQNSDYPQGTVDFSPICAKRREFTSVMNNILRIFPNHVFAATDLAKIRSIMQEEGMTIPCGICYVEDRRQLDTIVAQNFIDSLKLYREGSKTRPDGNAFNTNQLKGLKLTDGDSYTPSVYELVSLEGLNVLKEKNPNMAEAWVKFNNARGMQSVRLLANEAEYKRQILKYSKSTVKSKNDKGGLRVYSFSDAEMFHLIDIIQVITDSATVGLSLQGYTKVNEYAKAVKDTGEKLNRSLIPKGELGYHVEKGKVILDYDTVEGIDINHPDFFDNKDNPNVGNITIGVSDVQIRAAMVSDFVDQIIPFHTGQSEEVLGEKGISTWSNYKDFQTEKDIATGKVSDHQVNIYTEVLQVLEKEGKPITKRTFVEKYLQVCKENNLTPRFSQFLNTNEKGEYVYTEGYHKMLVDFKTFAQTEAGEYLPQRPVKPIFDNNYITKILKDYVKSQKVKDAELSKSMPKVIERITNEIVKPSETKYSTREVDTITDDEYTALKKHFGVTGNFKVAGYLLPDGKMLDFSGKHWGDTTSRMRQVDHRDAQEVLGRGNNGINDMIDMIGSGAIRLMPETGGINLAVYPNEKQRRVLSVYIKYMLSTEGQVIIDYDAVGGDTVYSKTYDKYASSSRILGDIRNYFNGARQSDLMSFHTMYSTREPAPTFYSQMGKVVEGIKQDKFAADSVIPMLRGRGIKAEEIRWSGIATFLEGKKSVTKQELQEFIAGSQLQIGEQVSGNDIDLRYNAGERSYTLYDKSGNVIDTYIYNEFMEGYVSELDDEVYSDANELEDAVREEYGEMSSPRWSEYKLDGGKNYREIVFTMPNSTYTNSAMKGHWGQDAEGVLVHARIQDFDVKGKKMLFIEELQSDWHNEGHSKGYSTKEYEDAVETHDKLYNEYKKLDLAFHKYIRSNEYMTDPEDVRKKKHDWLRRKAETAQKKYLEAEKVVSSLKEKGAGDTPDAPFKDTYHEYVLKRLLRMAAEQGYDSIGWTPADIQSKRWSEEYAEGYRIEYDQDMPKFLKKYGRQWGAKVEKSKAPNGEEIWSMDITDSMKDSVLHEGQILYSDRGVNKYGIEVYETSEKTKNLSYTERKNAFLEIMQNQYRGRTAKFIRNGHAYYARFEEADVRKNIYGDNRSDRKGIKAKVNVGADGNIFELVENTQYDGSKQEKGKTTLAHQQVVYWDYFIKTVQIDNKVFDLLANVRKKSDGGYVYSIQLNENKKVEASPPLIPIKGVSNRVLNASTDDILPQESKVVKQNSENFQEFSDRDPDSVSNRSLLANALETAAQNDIERNKLAQYKQKIDLIEAEEAKLHELREEIKELSFAKGRRDTEKIKRLQFEANQTANRINTYDRQLLNLEASKPLKAVLEREKAMAYKKAEQRGKEALAAYRERTAKTTRELMTRYQESRAKATEGRHKTEIRHKIKDVVSKLNQLLLRPTKDKHIKEGLRMAVAEALAVINMDTIGADERVAKYNELIAKTSDPDMIAELTRTRDRIELQGENLKDKLTALQSAYEKIKNSTDDDLKNAYQEAVMNTIKNVSEMVGNTSIRDMSLTQLEAVYEMYTMVLHTVRIANKMFKAEKGETITQTAEAVNEEVRTIGKEKFARNRFAAWLRETGWTLLKPFTAFRTIGSDTFTKLYTELRKGEDVFYEDVNEAKNFIQEKYKKYNFKSWDKKITKTFTAKSGKTFTLNLEQMMSLYAYSRRTQAHDHIIEGGIVLEDSVIEEKNKLGITMKYKVDTKTAFNISEETLDEICDSLTKEQRGFVDEMQAYLSDVMGAKGNEVSMELLGVKLFKEKFYFPLKSSKYYMGFKPEEAGEIKLKNPAFSKETVQHANNPVVLKDFTDVWATHINDMSMYHAFVLALEDFTRVYNYKTKTAENVETMSTEATIANAYGEGATEYIRNFLKSLNGGVRTENVGWADKMLSLSKKSAVLASTSVAIQQPSAIMRAMALIDPKHFVATTHKSINLLKHKQDWAELKTYAPIAGIKEMGRFDVGMGQSTVEWIKDQKTVMEKVDDTLGKAPQFMDEVTWVSIWNAVKRETASKNKGMDVTSEAFLKKAGERFTEVISLTQVYDSVFSRSDIMRNKSFAAKSLTAFMAEPTTTMNMMVDSIVQGKRGDKSVTAKTIGAISASILVNSALVALVYAARDDDEDETYLEKYLGSLTSELVDGFNPITYIPIVKDIWSIMQGYDIERSDMSLISNLWESIERLFSKGTVYDKVSDVAGSLAALFGIPVKNILREVETIYNLFGLISNDTPTTELGIKYAVSESAKDSIPLWGRFSKNKSNYDKLYDAIISGDQEQLERVKGRFDFENKNEYASALRKAIRENDPRIKKAAQAVIDGNHSERIRLTKEIVAEGHFTQDIVVGAINNELAYLREKLKEKK